MGVQPTEAGFTAAAGVCAVDPGDDGLPQCLAGGPVLAVEDVLLQQREEGLHGGVVSGRADSAHGSGQLMPVEGVDELPAAELRSALGMRDAAGHVAAVGMAPGDGVVD